MNPQEAKQYIVDRISVTRQKVVLAQAYILDLSKTTSASDQMVRRLRDHMDAAMPTGVVLHSSVDPLPSLQKAADAISWTLAACEAIWELIHSNMLIPTSTDLVPFAERLEWTTVVPGSGGQSAGWGFDEFSLAVPRTVARPPSLSSSAEQPLTNHDLYIRQIGISNMHQHIEEALKEAVKCFRHELYTSCLAMLGKASEGAWLEVGEALINSVSPADQPKVEKQRKELENPAVGIGKKVEAVLALYDRQDIFQAVADQSGIKLQELRRVAIWSDAIRDSRNTIHFRVDPSIPNTYEKVAALLVGAVPFFRVLYQIKGAADSAAGKSP